MWNYVRTTRIAVPDIQDVITKENRSMDKVQALFARHGGTCRRLEGIK